MLIHMQSRLFSKEIQKLQQQNRRKVLQSILSSIILYSLSRYRFQLKS